MAAQISIHESPNTIFEQSNIKIDQKAKSIIRQFQVADDLKDALMDESAIGKPTGQDQQHGLPNAVTELGVEGAMARFQDILSGTIASIPSCPGEAMLAQMVTKTARRIAPAAMVAAAE